MEHLANYWPLVAGIGVGIGAIAAFILTLLRIQHLRISIEELKAKVAESQRTVHIPTTEETERYGRQMEAMTSQLMKVTEAYESNADVMHRMTASATDQANMQHKLAESMASQNQQMENLVSETTDLLTTIKKEHAALREALRRLVD